MRKKSLQSAPTGVVSLEERRKKKAGDSEIHETELRNDLIGHISQKDLQAIEDAVMQPKLPSKYDHEPFDPRTGMPFDTDPDEHVVDAEIREKKVPVMKVATIDGETNHKQRIEELLTVSTVGAGETDEIEDDISDINGKVVGILSLGSTRSRISKRLQDASDVIADITDPKALAERLLHLRDNEIFSEAIQDAHDMDGINVDLWRFDTEDLNEQRNKILISGKMMDEVIDLMADNWPLRKCQRNMNDHRIRTLVQCIVDDDHPNRVANILRDFLSFFPSEY